MIAAAITLLLTPAEATRLHPVLDRPYRLVSEEVRQFGGQPHRFTAERRLVFHREPDGLVAELTLERLSTDLTGDAARRFLVGSGGIKGRPVRFHLTEDGKVRSVDDLAAVWAATLSGVRAMAPPPDMQGQAAPISRDPAGPLAGLSPERQVAMLGSTLEGICLDPAAIPASGSHLVRVPARVSGPGAVSLSGTEVIEPIAGGLVRRTLHGAGGNASMSRTTIVDPATGLLVSEDEQLEIRLGERSLPIHSTKRLTLLVS